MFNSVLITEEAAHTDTLAAVEQIDLGTSPLAIDTDETGAGEQLGLTQGPIFFKHAVIINSRWRLFKLSNPCCRLEMQTGQLELSPQPALGDVFAHGAKFSRPIIQLIIGLRTTREHKRTHDGNIKTVPRPLYTRLNMCGAVSIG